MWKCGAALASFILAGCGQNNITAPPVVSAHHVVIVNNRNEQIKTITDAGTVCRLAAFVNDRRTKWQIPWYGIPVGHTRVEFYAEDDSRVGSCSIGENFFERMFMSGNDPVWCVRQATASELNEFNNMLATTAPPLDKQSGLPTPK